MNKPESEILKEIMKFLNDNDFICWRNHVFNGRVKGGYLRCGLIGLTDATVMLKGAHLYIEVKTETGKQRDSQEAFELTCKSHGHEYLLARSVKDVRDKLIKMGEL